MNWEPGPWVGKWGGGMVFHAKGIAVAKAEGKCQAFKNPKARRR